MERERLGAWLDGYGRAWEQADPPAVLGLFTPDATYRAHPLGRAYTGHDAIADYWTRATAGQRDIQVRFGDPIVDGDRVAAEFWSTMRGDGGPVTVAGCLLLALAPDGRCRSLRECWDVDQVVSAITLDREEVPIGILEPGDLAAASAG
jgi:ketosteroid isomerase-like protein